MAEMGNHVVCYDLDEDKIARLKTGEIPLYEPGLDAYVERNVEVGRLDFTTDVKKAVDHGLYCRMVVEELTWLSRPKRAYIAMADQ
jgi:UDPglucose 6-dehydrogenase